MVSLGPPMANEHDLVIVDSDADLRAVATAFLAEGVAAGDLVHAALPGWLVEELAPLPGVVLTASEQAPRVREPDLIVTIRAMVADHAPGRLRLLSLVTAPAGRAWDERARCEAVTNLAFAGLPVSILCLYDQRSAPPDALSAALRTHPHVWTGRGNVLNPRYQDAREFLAALPVPDEPLERTEPLFAVDDVPSLPGLRHQLTAALRGRARNRDIEEDFHLAVSEIAANAFRHGVRPVSARLWATRNRLVCSITDGGTSYADPVAGYRPAHGDDLSRGGMGLWLARKLCDHVDLIRGPRGLTVRLVTALD